MWLMLKNQNDKAKFAELEPKATIGSARSNKIVIEGRGVRPLHGQITIEQDRLCFRDFSQRVSQALDLGATFQLGAWDIRVCEARDIWRFNRESLLEDFKELIRHGEDSLDTYLDRIREARFLSSSVPDEVAQKLKAHYREFTMSGPIEYLLEDADTTDILVESFDRIWVERRGELSLSGCHFSSDETYTIYLENLLSALHKSLDENTPFVDFVFPDGARGHLIGPPVTSGPRYLSVRKTKTDIGSLEHLRAKGAIDEITFRLLKEALNERLNILISGATGSGKTTLLRTLLRECPAQERLLVIEDTPELWIDRFNAAFLNTRVNGNVHLASISLRTLVRQALRMRPDRIIVGEVRGEEAMDLLHAMNTGHRGCMGSLHANSARDALYRLQGLIQMSDARLSEPVVRDLIARNIHLVLHCGRRADGQRRVQELGFVRGIDQSQILMELRSL